MPVRKIRRFGDPVLRDRCAEVTQFDEGLERLVVDLMDTCRLPGRAGVAAPQIGVVRRVFSYDVDGVEGYLINPRLVRSEGSNDDVEGCLSVGDLYLPTVRADHVVVAGIDLEGRPVELEGSGLLARCFQHEIDHLDGRLFLDRLSPEHRREAMRAIRRRELDAELADAGGGPRPGR